MQNPRDYLERDEDRNPLSLDAKLKDDGFKLIKILPESDYYSDYCQVYRDFKGHQIELRRAEDARNGWVPAVPSFLIYVKAKNGEKISEAVLNTNCRHKADGKDPKPCYHSYIQLQL